MLLSAWLHRLVLLITKIATSNSDIVIIRPVKILCLCNDVFFVIISAVISSNNYRVLSFKVLTMEKEKALAALERKILQKIYGPVKENDIWRIRQNDKFFFFFYWLLQPTFGF
jgi:hypothetical protein